MRILNALDHGWEFELKVLKEEPNDGLRMCTTADRFVTRTRLQIAMHAYMGPENVHDDLRSKCCLVRSPSYVTHFTPSLHQNFQCGQHFPLFFPPPSTCTLFISNQNTPSWTASSARPLIKKLIALTIPRSRRGGSTKISFPYKLYALNLSNGRRTVS